MKISDKELLEMDEQAIRESALTLLITDASGQYIPQIFAKHYNGWKGWHKGDWQFLAGSKSNEKDEYWEVWDTCLQNLTKKVDGVVFSLYQDGDLWAIDYQLVNRWQELTGKEFFV